MGSLVREYRVFPSGDTFKPTETINNIDEGTTITLHDPGPIYEAPPTDTDYDYCVYNRAFWNIAGTIKTGASVNATIKGVTTATCWYTYGCSPGFGENAITCYAFDVAANVNLAGTTPISSVVPAGLWTAPDNSVMPSTSGSITIDAKDAIGSTPFSKWLLFGTGTASGDDVVIPANGGGFYVAFYAKPKSSPFDFGKFDLDDVLKKWPDLEIDWVVDPSPLDRVRLMLIAAQLQAQGEAAPTFAGGAGDARKELTRVRAELKRLETRAKQLEEAIRQ